MLSRPICSTLTQTNLYISCTAINLTQTNSAEPAETLASYCCTREISVKLKDVLKRKVKRRDDSFVWQWKNYIVNCLFL